MVNVNIPMRLLPQVLDLVVKEYAKLLDKEIKTEADLSTAKFRLSELTNELKGKDERIAFLEREIAEKDNF